MRVASIRADVRDDERDPPAVAALRSLVVRVLADRLAFANTELWRLTRGTVL
ncbi:MAG: hypothetical protein ACOCYE_07700 [Pseudomonadota bacterium]